MHPQPHIHCSAASHAADRAGSDSHLGGNLYTHRNVDHSWLTTITRRSSLGAGGGSLEGIRSHISIGWGCGGERTRVPEQQIRHAAEPGGVVLRECGADASGGGTPDAREHGFQHF